MPGWRMRQAISEAIAAEMERDDRVVLLGEDVGAAEGVFKTSEGLIQRFGPARVRDTPIAEMGFTGLAVGAAALGRRPVVEIMFGEFAGVALDQITTEAAKLRYLSKGQFGALDRGPDVDRTWSRVRRPALADLGELVHQHSRAQGRAALRAGERLLAAARGDSG